MGTALAAHISVAIQTTVENEAQALTRAAPAPDGRDKGGEAVRACLALIDLKRRFQGEGQ